MADQTATPRPAKLPCPLPAWDGPSKVFEPLTGQPAARGLGGSTGAGVRETCCLPPILMPDILLYAGFQKAIRIIAKSPALGLPVVLF